MSAANTTKRIGVGLLGLPLYGVLTFWSSLDPQPDPNTDYEAWSRYARGARRYTGGGRANRSWSRPRSRAAPPGRRPRRTPARFGGTSWLPYPRSARKRRTGRPPWSAG